MNGSLIIFLVGAIAQMIDGGIGMGYGTVSASLLITLGVSAAMTSAAVHTAEIFTTFVSGTSHWRMGNVDKKIFFPLTAAGVVGGVTGAYFLVNISDTRLLTIIVATILFVLGGILVHKFLIKKHDHPHIVPKKGRIYIIGFVAALIDAIGGGGWGNIATPSLIVNKAHPRQAIGSVNLAEFFVTIAISFSFFALLPSIEWKLVLPLVLGSILLAPFAAYLTKRLPHRAAGIFVGILIMVLSARTILRAFGISIL